MVLNTKKLILQSNFQSQNINVSMKIRFPSKYKTPLWAGTFNML